MSLYYAEACNEFARLISASSGHCARATRLLPKKCCSGGNTESDSTSPRFELQTSRSRYERVSARPADKQNWDLSKDGISFLLPSTSDFGEIPCLRSCRNIACSYKFYFFNYKTKKQRFFIDLSSIELHIGSYQSLILEIFRHIDWRLAPIPSYFNLYRLLFSM